MVQLLQKTVWQFLERLNIEFNMVNTVKHMIAILFLDTY